jgi:hypothetical protein
MHEEVIRELNYCGYFPQREEVILSIGEAVAAIWRCGDTVDLPAVVFLVEDLLFASERYFNSLKMKGH